MNRNFKKFNYKPMEKNTRDRGDLKKILLSKEFEDLTINDFILTHDRGDSRVIPVKAKRVESPKRHLNSKLTRSSVDKKTVTEIGTNSILSSANRNIQKFTYGNKDREELRRKDQRAKVIAKKEAEQKKTEDAEAETTTLSQDVRRKEHNTKVVAKKEKDKNTEEVKAKTTHFSERKDVNRPAEKIEEHETEQLNVSENDLLIKIGEGTKAKLAVISPIKDTKIFDKPQVQNRTYLDFEGRKLIREKYTVKLKNNQNANKRSDVNVENYKESTKNDDRDIKTQTNDETTEKLKANESSDRAQSETTKSDKKSREMKKPVAQRKPMIKTIRLNRDNRVYKAVTFMDKMESTPLQIIIPTHLKKEKKSSEPKLLMPKIVTESKVPVQIKSNKKDKRRLLKTRTMSPCLQVASDLSPPTEVAEWAPSCVNGHTKPYYEAWVNTTLAAITKCYDEKMFKGKNVFETFKRVLPERPNTPELAYGNLNDERFTGRIRVRRRS